MTGHPLKHFRRGFTLIELLIVVAIIAILAAIAVPNFLEAQTRSKVARTFADMRTIRTAIESYRVDANAYPETDRGIQVLQNNDIRSIFRLTTPVSYLTSIPPSPWKENYGTGSPANPKIASAVTSYLYVRQLADPFGPTGSGAQSNVNAEYMGDRWAYIHQGALVSAAERARGHWLLKSVGPDNIDDRDGSNPRNIEDGITPDRARLYDPTNGTISRGDIVIFSDGLGSLR